MALHSRGLVRDKPLNLGKELVGALPVPPLFAARSSGTRHSQWSCPSPAKVSSLFIAGCAGGKIEEWLETYLHLMGHPTYNQKVESSVLTAKPPVAHYTALTLPHRWNLPLNLGQSFMFMYP